MNVGDTLRSSAQRLPRKPALFSVDTEISYQSLDESVTALAKWFLEQGLEPGDRVAVRLTNSIPTVQLLYGLFKAGLTAVTVNTRLKPAEIEFILSHSQSRMCFSDPLLSPPAQQANAGCPIFTQLPALETAVAQDATSPPVDQDQPALLIYTSGTTAPPKGVVHTHRSLYHTAILASGALGSAAFAEGVSLCILPLMHMARSEACWDRSM